jgi:Fe2+ or Zn2+ uptake regulation protein
MYEENMKPLELLKRYKETENDLIADCILQTLNGFGEPVTTYTLVMECLETKVSSPATTHHKLDMLKRLGFVKQCNSATDNDNRKKWIKVSARGALYLERWEQP